MKRKPYPYDKFVDTLVENGKSPITATTYAAQARRIIRNCDCDEMNTSQMCMIHPDDIDRYILTQSPKSQTPYRRAWKSFCDFMKSEGFTLPDADLSRGVKFIPKHVGDALADMNKQSFVFRKLCHMRWEITDNAFLKSRFEDDYVLVFSSGPENERKKTNICIPKRLLNPIKEWAYPNQSLEEILGKILIPRSPNSDIPMPVSMMRKAAGII